MPTRKTGLDVTVFEVEGTELIDHVQNFTLNVEVAQEDGKGVSDEWNFPIATGRNWSLEGDVFVHTSATLMAIAASSDTLVTIEITSGTQTFTGNALVGTVGHQVQREGLQVQRIRFSGQGALTIA